MMSIDRKFSRLKETSKCDRNYTEKTHTKVFFITRL